MVIETSKVNDEASLQKYIMYLLRKKKVAADGDPERVLLVAADNILSSYASSSVSSYAKKIAAGVSGWNSSFRLHKSPPKSPAQSVVVNFFPGSESERRDNVSEAMAIEVTRELVKAVAPGERIISYVVHGDTNHLHVHAVFSSVCSEGKVWNPRKDFRLWEAAASQLEVKYGLHVTANRIALGAKNEDVAIKGAVLQQERRTGLASEKRKLKVEVEKLLGNYSLGFSEFAAEARRRNISLVLNRASTGTITGLSFRLGEGPLFKASELNRAWSWNRLSERLRYDAVVDQRLVLQLEALKPKTVKLELRKAILSPQSALQMRIYDLGAPHRKKGTELKRFRWETDSTGARHYYWRAQKRLRAPVFSDFGEVLVSNGPANNLTFGAMAELARAKGWSAVEIFASDPKTATRLWFECVIQGVNVVNFTPDETMLVELLSEEYQEPVPAHKPTKQLLDDEV